MRWSPAVLFLVAVVSASACSSPTTTRSTPPPVDPTPAPEPATTDPATRDDLPAATGDDGPAATGDDGPAATGDDGPAAAGDDGPAATGDDDPAAPGTTQAPPPLQGLAYEEVASVDFPSIAVPGPDGDGMLVAERSGAVRPLLGGELGEAILDLSARTTTGGERGLLGLAVHPDDATRLFVHYTDTGGDTTVSEFTLADDGAALDSEEVLLTVRQPASNHNGGMIQFGPDRALYLGLGDGGAADDRFGNGQNTDTLLGGLVRIDVDTGDAELWHYGLRNPWRFWIDGEDIWIGDVGQNAHEEVDLAPVTRSGINYGWPITEGDTCFQSSDCDTEGITMPIVDIGHGDAGTCSITGGVVYRGAAIPELDGRFLFSDFCGGYLRSTDATGSVVDHTRDVGVPGSVVSFGTDPAGEVYVLTTDRILRIVPVR